MYREKVSSTLPKICYFEIYVSELCNCDTCHSQLCMYNTCQQQQSNGLVGYLGLTSEVIKREGSDNSWRKLCRCVRVSRSVAALVMTNFLKFLKESEK
jgi:hypothetical protein